MRRIAAIDVGTNSVRLLVVETARTGFRIVDEEKAQVRLGEGLGSTGELAEEAQSRTIEALARMLTIARDLGAEAVRGVATHAVRDARNGDAFVERVERETGFALEVLSAAEEGRLAFLGASANFALPGRTAVVDVGGGSVEIVRATDGEIEAISSLPLGAVVLSEMLPTGEDPPSPRSLRALRRHVRRTLEAEFGARPDAAALVVGSGGTVTSLGAVVAAQREEDFASVHGREIAAADIVHAHAFLRSLRLEDRRHVPGLPPYRADIILGGTLLLREVMRLLRSNRLLVNTKGLREGLIIDTLARAGRPTAPADERAALLAFARRCRADRRHAEHVARLAAAILAQAGPPHPATGDARLLEAAALLHDVGYFIAYRSHHKHSCHLIAHADLPGFTPREVALIATIARYHRGALPKLEHEEFARLAPEDRETVMRLGGVLKLADGLDRGRAQRVGSVTLRRDDRTATLTLGGEADLHVEVYGAREKGNLFEKAYGVTLELKTG